MFKKKSTPKAPVTKNIMGMMDAAGMATAYIWDEPKSRWSLWRWLKSLGGSK